MILQKITFENWRAAVAIAALVGVLTGVTAVVVNYANTPENYENYIYAETKYGAFLAQQHAILINDFRTAAHFAEVLQDEEIKMIQNTGILAKFLVGELDDSAAALKTESGIQHKLIYAAHLVQSDDWRDVYEIFKGIDTLFFAPVRIFASVGAGHEADAMRYINSLGGASESWRDWMRGMIHAETGKHDEAKRQFEKVSLDFMNLNDYLYLMAFYRNNGFDESADMLHEKFTQRPGGLYMLNQKLDLDWAHYSGYRNALAFAVIQTVSHSPMIARSDMGILLLRLAQQIGPQASSYENDTLNYYLGVYFFENAGNFREYFEKIPKTSVFYPFVLSKYAENAGNFNAIRRELRASVQKNPLFVPAIVRLVGLNIRHGQKSDALRVLNDALNQPNLPDIGRAFFLKNRAHVYLMFGDLNRAQKDLDTATDILPSDAGVLSEQARLWALQNRRLDDAYEYAIALVKKFPAEIEVWDTLGMVVKAKEGAAVALPIFEKIGRVAESCSSLFENLGDIYADMGDVTAARVAYTRAILLSDDGMTIESVLRDKLKALKALK